MSEATDPAEAEEAAATTEGEPDSSIDLASLSSRDYLTRTGTFGNSALPHRYANEGVTFELDKCVTDRDAEVPLEETTNELSAIGKEWSEITITGTIEVEDWAFEHVVPTDDGRIASEWEGRLGLVYWCRDTIYRGHSDAVASVDSPGEYGEFEITLDRDDVWKSVKFRPALVRTKSEKDAESDPEDEFATYPGQRLADGKVWTLRTDLERSTSTLLHPETKNFSEHDDLPGDDHLIFVDLDRDPPGVYLNGDHERIIATLDNDSNRGWEASVRDVTYDLIEAEVWPQFILEAASEITGEGGPETPWKQKVIEKFREQLYGDGTSYEEAVQLLHQDVSSPERLPRLMQDIDDAIQTRNDPPSHLNSVFTLIDNR